MRDLLSDLSNYALPAYISASEMTYIVSSGALNSTHSLTHPHITDMRRDTVNDVCTLFGMSSP